MSSPFLAPDWTSAGRSERERERERGGEIPSRSEYQSESSEKSSKRKKARRASGRARERQTLEAPRPPSRPSNPFTPPSTTTTTPYLPPRRFDLTRGDDDSARRAKVCRGLSSRSLGLTLDTVGGEFASRCQQSTCAFSPPSHPAFSTTTFFLCFCFASPRWTHGEVASRAGGLFFLPPSREMSERRRSAAALSSRAHAFSVEALIGSNKKRKLRGWEEKELELSMESLGADGEDPAAHCLDMDPGQSVCQSVSPSVSPPLDMFPQGGHLLFCGAAEQHKATVDRAARLCACRLIPVEVPPSQKCDCRVILLPCW